MPKEEATIDKMKYYLKIENGANRWYVNTTKYCTPKLKPACNGQMSNSHRYYYYYYSVLKIRISVHDHCHITDFIYKDYIVFTGCN